VDATIPDLRHDLEVSMTLQKTPDPLSDHSLLVDRTKQRVIPATRVSVESLARRDLSNSTEFNE
jgi:hypothetical protein